MTPETLLELGIFEESSLSHTFFEAEASSPRDCTKVLCVEQVDFAKCGHSEELKLNQSMQI